MLLCRHKASQADLFLLCFIVLARFVVTVRPVILVTVLCAPIFIRTVRVDSCDDQHIMKVVIVMMMSVRYVKHLVPLLAT